ncbi:MAG: ATP-binding protein [Candidatus Dactylopiibacterium sp.]|nr:ATP-binding protein [Candidatus Dactylopiibacterium sp.]
MAWKTARLPPLPAPRWPKASLHSYLVAMSLVASIPIAGVMSYHLVGQIREQNRRLHEGLQRTAAMLALNVSRELRATADTLTFLGYSRELQEDEPAQFAQALQQRQIWRQSWSSLYLRTASGTVLFDTACPDLTQLPGAAPCSGLPAPDPSRTVVSDQLIGKEDGNIFTSVEVPVTAQGAARYLLGARIAPATWHQILTAAGTDLKETLGLHDRALRLLASGDSPAAPAPPAWGEPARLEVLAAADGRGRLAMADGGHAYAAWEHVPLAGWRVLAATPAALIDRAHYASLATALGTTFLCLLLGVTLASVVARQMTRPLYRLARNELPEPGERVPVREIALLRDALAQAAARQRTAHAVIHHKQEALEKKADEFETMLASCPIGIAFGEDTACRKLRHNVVMQDLFGTDAAGVPREAVAVLHHGQRLAPAQQPLQRAAARGHSTFGMELEIRRPGHAPLFVIFNAVPLHDERGAPRGAIGAALDITGRKAAEERLSAAEQHLRENTHLIDLAQESGQVGFFHYQPVERKLSWTPGQARLFGFGEGQAPAGLAAWTRHIARASWFAVARPLLRACRAGRDGERVDYCIFVGEGETRWLSTRVRLLYGPEGEPRHLIGVSLDMTEQKNAERERDLLMVWEQAARIEAEQASRAKDEFLAMLGHELRNPLSAITSGVAVLARVPGDSEVAADARRIIARQARHLANMMDDLMGVAHVLSGQRFERGPIALDAVAQRVVAAQEMAGDLARHEVGTDLRPVWINAHATRLEQILNNLLTNALKYTPPGGRVRIRVAREGPDAVLEVEDNGVGIPDDLLPHVFDLFVQGQRTLDRRGGGLGIGLTLVRRLVEMHDGRIAVRDAGPGTVMRVTFPAIAAPDGTPHDARVAPGQPRRIVVIEDNEDVLRGLLTALRLEGHTAWAARDGTSGLGLILDEQPDLAIVDIGLPGLTGYEVARRAREAGYAGKLFAVSGYGQARDRLRAQEARFDMHFVKPVQHTELFAAIDAL